LYSSLSIEAFRKAAGLPEDYTVDGLLISGTWDLYADTKHTPLVKEALQRIDPNYSIVKLEPLPLGHGYEIKSSGKTYWYVPVMGAAVTSQYAHLASLLGSKKNLLIGTVGGLKRGIQPGDFIIPTYSKGNENALMYERERTDLFFPSHEDLSESLNTRLEGKAVYRGITNTCEVMFAETMEDVEEWSYEGYLGVEMEAALMFALSNSFGIPSAALLYVADNLVEEIAMHTDEYESSRNIRDNARKVQYEQALRELLES
jgi:purine-nucleoside phosphorylase